MKQFETKIFNLRPSPDEVAKQKGENPADQILAAGMEKGKALEALGTDGWEIKGIYQDKVFLQREVPLPADNR